jgi:hypothetical protein
MVLRPGVWGAGAECGWPVEVPEAGAGSGCLAWSGCVGVGAVRSWCRVPVRGGWRRWDDRAGREVGFRAPGRRVGRWAGASGVQPWGASAVEGPAAMSGRHGKHRTTTVAMVYGIAGDPVEVLCDAATDPPGQRWFTVVLDDATGPDGPSEAPVCVGCLLDEHPRLGWGARCGSRASRRTVGRGRLSAGTGAMGRMIRLPVARGSERDRGSKVVRQRQFRRCAWANPTLDARRAARAAPSARANRRPERRGRAFVPRW